MTLFALFFVLNTTAWAGKIFNWKNETGQTNFTDYRSNIPLKHRDQIKDKVTGPGTKPDLSEGKSMPLRDPNSKRRAHRSMAPTPILRPSW